MAKDPVAIYNDLKKFGRKTSIWNSIEHLLHWDQETYLPKAAIAYRGQQIEEISHTVHKLKTSSAFAKLLGQLIDLESGEIVFDSLSQRQMIALKRWRKDFLQSKKLSSGFVKKFATLTSASCHVWADARKNQSFKDFSPYLKKIVEMTRKKADLLGYQHHPYDALLELYEPDVHTSQLNPLFSNLKMELSSLLKQISRSPQVDTTFLKQEFPKQGQKHFLDLLLEKMGFVKDTYRLDESNHPFCSRITPLDTRMTTRIDTDNLSMAVFSTLHEAGHAIYEIHFPDEEYGTPLGEAVSYGIHESQSRIWETIMGQSLPFWTHFFPILQNLFQEEMRFVTLNQFYRGINEVSPSFIRIDSDEVCYSLHIILRFEIEKKLIEGSLTVKEIPEFWNESMRTYFGIAPSNDAEGCLQDIHWSLGYFGYFPSYALGNLYAAQFYKGFEKDHSNWKDLVSDGNLLVFSNWLKKNIHEHGREFSSAELLKRASGETVSIDPYVGYLKKKYNEIYNLV